MTDRTPSAKPRRVTRLRHLVRQRPALAALIVAAALLLRLVVPAGFMPTLDHGRVTLTVCSGYGPVTMSMAMPGMAHHDPAAAQSPCAFADLALPALGAADPVLLAAALRHVIVAALLLAAIGHARRPARLRPPLRAPPLPA